MQKLKSNPTVRRDNIEMKSNFSKCHYFFRNSKRLKNNMNCLIFGLYRKKRGELTVRITGGISCSKELKAKPMGYILISDFNIFIARTLGGDKEVRIL